MDEAVASGDAIVIPVGGNRVVTYDFDTVENAWAVLMRPSTR